MLAPFPEPLQRRARRDLERLGVEVRLGTRVTGVDVGTRALEQPDAPAVAAGGHVNTHMVSPDGA